MANQSQMPTEQLDQVSLGMPDRSYLLKGKFNAKAMLI